MALDLAGRFVIFTEGASRRGPTLLVVAHPDDESLGAGALLASLAPAVFVLHLSDGAPHDTDGPVHRSSAPARRAYAATRRAELYRAMQEAGLPPSHLSCLGFVDQQLSWLMADVTRALLMALRALRPAVVVTHAYEGGHPDHDATAFAVHAACQRLPSELCPLVCEMGLYYLAGSEVRRLQLLPGAGRVLDHRLSDDEQQRKQAMLASFESQLEVVRLFPADRESYRREPRPDFRRPPHPGQLHYEHHPWGITGARWRELAGESAAALGVSLATIAGEPPDDEQGQGGDERDLAGPRVDLP